MHNMRCPHDEASVGQVEAWPASAPAPSPAFQQTRTPLFTVGIFDTETFFVSTVSEVLLLAILVSTVSS